MNNEYLSKNLSTHLETAPVIFTKEVTLNPETFAPRLTVNFHLPLELRDDCLGQSAHPTVVEVLAEHIKQQFINFLKG